MLMSSMFCLGNVTVHAPKKSGSDLRSFFFPKDVVIGMCFFVPRLVDVFSPLLLDTTFL